MQKMLSLPRSSGQAIEAVKQVWGQLIQLVEDSKAESLGRGFVFYQQPNDALIYYSLLDLQQCGPELIGCTDELFSELRRLVGVEYDYRTEFVFVVPRQDAGGVLRFIAQIAPLDADSWQLICSEEKIREQERTLQLQSARMLRESLKRQRQGKR